MATSKTFRRLKVRTQEADYFDKLDKLKRITKRVNSTNAETQAVISEFDNQLSIAFKKSGFPAHTKAKFDKVYGEMILGIGFEIYCTPSAAGYKTPDTHKRFSGASTTKMLQYLHPYLPGDYCGHAEYLLSGLLDGGVYKTDSEYYKKDAKADLVQEEFFDELDMPKVQAAEIAWVNNISRAAKFNAQRISRLVTGPELERMGVEDGKLMPPSAWFEIHARIVAELKKVCIGKLSQVIEPTLDFQRVDFKEFYLPKRKTVAGGYSVSAIVHTDLDKDKTVPLILTKALEAEITEKVAQRDQTI